MDEKKVTLIDLQRAKEEGRKLVMLIAYDYPFGLLADEANVDIVLVGDSLGMFVMGLESTVSVSMEQMIHHIKAVVRGCKKPLIIGDMPFMSYNTSIRDAIVNAGRLMKEGGCDAIKLEGGLYFGPTVEAIVKAGIPVQGHIGLTPQTMPSQFSSLVDDGASASASSGSIIQGCEAAAAKQIIEDAKILENSGVFSIVLEAVPAPLGQLVAEKVRVPVIGIGAGPNVDGQVLVPHHMIGLFEKPVPKFVKQYTQIRKMILEAFSQYKKEVLDGTFPGPEHSFKMPDEALKQLNKMLKG